MIQTKPGNATDVIFGGGYLAFNAVGKPDNEWDCIRKDGLNLIQQWKNQHISSNTSHNFVSNLQELKQVVESSDKKPEKILGIFGNGHLPYEYEKPNTQPTLSEMTQAAIELLHANVKDEKGFFLMVEGMYKMVFFIPGVDQLDISIGEKHFLFYKVQIILLLSSPMLASSVIK